ncbi:hypothetical protein [Leclercia adecarboxylata]|uniref:hypothetical protein n=1 Tax=Leclercia adecarboxylata TaxID=83655 RepID=UPI0038501DA2
MTTFSNLYSIRSDECVIQQLITLPPPADTDLFEVADYCGALVIALVGTNSWRK